jgi:hypothetical protein
MGTLRQLLAVALLLIAAQTSFAQSPESSETQPETPDVVTELEAEASAATAEGTEAVTAAPEAPLFTSRTARNEQLLAASLPDDALWLADDAESILALFRPTETATTKGLVFFLHATATPPEWPVLLENARRNLPQLGWATLAVTLPSKTAPTPAPRDPLVPDAPADLPLAPDTVEANTEETAAGTGTTASEPVNIDTPPVAETNAPTPSEVAAGAEAVEGVGSTGSTGSAETAATANATAQPEADPEEAPTDATVVLSRGEIIHKRVAAAQDWMAQADYTARMLVVDNSSVREVAAYLQTQPAGAITALILVNLQPQEALTTAELDQLFSTLALPVLDVFPAPTHAALTAQRKRHRGAALRNRLPDYHQMLLPPQQMATLDDNKNFWVERLRGFLERQK